MRSTLAIVLTAFISSACSSTPGANDAGPVDSGVRLDGGADAGLDAGSVDAGPDAGPSDAGFPDAGLDAGIPDSGPDDAGPSDGGLEDGGPGDAGTPNGGSGNLDAGPYSVAWSVACLMLNDHEFNGYGEYRGYVDSGCTGATTYLTGEGLPPFPMNATYGPCPCDLPLVIRFVAPAGYTEWNYEVSDCVGGSVEPGPQTDPFIHEVVTIDPDACD